MDNFLNMSTLKFITPTIISVSGCTSSGKTYFVRNLLKYRNEMFDQNINNIIYCYNVWQNIYNEIEKEMDVEFHEGILNEEKIKNINGNDDHSIIVIDDLQHKLINNKEYERLFTQMSHHNNITVIYVIQNMYYPGLKTLSLNTHYNILFKNLRDINQLQMFARQTGFKNTLMESYRDATSVPYGYLCVDLNPHCENDSYRLRTNILPPDYTVIYQSK